MSEETEEFKKSVLDQLGKQQEPLNDRMLAKMLDYMSTNTQLFKFTVLRNDEELINIMKMIVANELYYKKYANPYVTDSRGIIKTTTKIINGKRTLIKISNPEYTIYDGIINKYLELKISNNNGLGRKQNVDMWVGFQAGEQRKGLGGVFDSLGKTMRGLGGIGND